MTATIYLRVSTEQQADSGLGLEAQLAQCREAAGRLGLEVSGVFTDAGISGAKGLDRDGMGLDLESRPALLDAIDSLNKGDVLLVAKRDRLGRDTILCALVERLVAKRGGSIVSAGGEACGNDPTDVLMRRIVDAFAEYERLLIGARTSAAMRRLKAQGKHTGGGVPYGWALANGALVESSAEQAVLRLALDLRASGLSLRATARELESRGHRPRSGGRWHATQIRRMLAEEGTSHGDRSRAAGVDSESLQAVR